MNATAEVSLPKVADVLGKPTSTPLRQDVVTEVQTPPKEKVDELVRQAGQDLAKEFPYDVNGLNRALTAFPHQERTEDVLMEWATRVAAAHLLIPSAARNLPEHQKADFKKEYLQILREEALAILMARKVTMVRQQSVNEILLPPTAEALKKQTFTSLELPASAVVAPSNKEVDELVRQAGQDLAKEFPQDVIGLNRKLSTFPHQERIEDVLMEWATNVAATRLPVPSATRNLPEHQQAGFKKEYLRILKEEALAILAARRVTMARQESIDELIKPEQK